MNIYFDARTSLVYLCAGVQVIGWMRLGDYRGLVGVEGVRWLLQSASCPPESIAR